MPPFCTQCGTALEPDVKFCKECGAQVIGREHTGALLPKRISLLVALSLAAVFVIGFLFLFASNPDGITKRAGNGEKTTAPKDTPAAIKKLVFDGPAFTAPIVLSLPREDSHELLNEMKNTVYGLTPIILIPNVNDVAKGF